MQQMEAEAKKPSAVGIMTEGDASDSEEEDVPEETKAYVAWSCSCSTVKCSAHAIVRCVQRHIWRA